MNPAITLTQKQLTDFLLNVAVVRPVFIWGAPGVGKSALANVLAAELATELHEVLGQSISSPSDLNALLLGARDKDVIHIDECHEMLCF